MLKAKFLIFAAVLTPFWLAAPSDAEMAPRPAPGVSAHDAARKKGLESDVVGLLYAYTSAVPDKDWSKDIAPSDPYIRGYLHFKKGEYAEAKPLFEQAIQEGSFSPASHYMLADIVWRKYRSDGYRGDLSEAYSQLDRASAEDPEYPSPYYLRGIILWGQANDAKKALDSLAKAAALSRGNCRAIHDSEEIDKVWRRPDTKEVLPGLGEVQKSCAQAHNMEAEFKEPARKSSQPAP